MKLAVIKVENGDLKVGIILTSNKNIIQAMYGYIGMTYSYDVIKTSVDVPPKMLEVFIKVNNGLYICGDINEIRSDIEDALDEEDEFSIPQRKLKK